MRKPKGNQNPNRSLLFVDATKKEAERFKKFLSYLRKNAMKLRPKKKEVRTDGKVASPSEGSKTGFQVKSSDLKATSEQ